MTIFVNPMTNIVIIQLRIYADYRWYKE